MREYNSGRHITECEINGKRVEYDACSGQSFEQALKSHEARGFQYIGSSDQIWINGVKQSRETKPHHFFVLKENMNKQFTPKSGMVFELEDGRTGLFVDTDNGLWMVFSDNTHNRYTDGYLDGYQEDYARIVKISKGMNVYGHWGSFNNHQSALRPRHIVWERKDDTVSVQLNESYTATVKGDEIEVGCQKFPVTKLRELLEVIDCVEKSSRVGMKVPFRDVKVGEKIRWDGNSTVYERTEYREYKGHYTACMRHSGDRIAYADPDSKVMVEIVG